MIAGGQGLVELRGCGDGGDDLAEGVPEGRGGAEFAGLKAADDDLGEIDGHEDFVGFGVLEEVARELRMKLENSPEGGVIDGRSLRAQVLSIRELNRQMLRVRRVKLSFDWANWVQSMRSSRVRVED